MNFGADNRMRLHHGLGLRPVGRAEDPPQSLPGPQRARAPPRPARPRPRRRRARPRRAGRADRCASLAHASGGVHPSNHTMFLFCSVVKKFRKFRICGAHLIRTSEAAGRGRVKWRVIETRCRVRTREGGQSPSRPRCQGRTRASRSSRLRRSLRAKRRFANLDPRDGGVAPRRRGVCVPRPAEQADSGSRRGLWRDEAGEQ